MTHLREAAHHSGLTWPHAECTSLDIAGRLGCQMLLARCQRVLALATRPDLQCESHRSVVAREPLRAGRPEFA